MRAAGIRRGGKVEVSYTYIPDGRGQISTGERMRGHTSCRGVGILCIGRDDGGPALGNVRLHITVLLLPVQSDTPSHSPSADYCQRMTSQLLRSKVDSIHNFQLPIWPAAVSVTRNQSVIQSCVSE